MMLTTLSAVLSFVEYEYCRVVAVTAEKKVATVVMVRYLDVSCACAERIKGIPERSNMDNGLNLPHSSEGRYHFQ